MAVLQIYKNEACTELWQSIPIIELHPSRIGWGQTAAGTITLGEKTYKYFDVSMYQATALQDVPQITAAPFMSKYKTITTQQYYCKNGYSLQLGVTENATIMSNYRYGSSALGFSEQNAVYSETSSPSYWVIGFTDPADGTRYIGFTRVIIQAGSVWPGYVGPTSCIEASFWESALRPPYDYGSGTDADGGQGDGRIPHSDIPLTENPRRIMPFGGHGLHAYRVNLQAYNSIQGFLWGETNTIAKSLWQKFMNHNHTPVQCIVGAYSLPEQFMPSGSAAAGVQLGGTMLKPIAGSCQDVTANIGFLTTELFTFNTAPEPFHSWLDYTGIQAILHIPFCGTIQIAAEYVVNRNVQFRYRVDQLNGNVVAIVYAAGRVIAEISGNCAYSVPVSGGDDGTLQRLGATLAGVLQLSAGNYAGALSSAAEAASAVHHTQIVNSDMHGSMTACENRVPYIEWIYPTTAYTPDYYKANGVPCEFSGTLSAFAGGYGEFEVLPASLNIPDATAAEKEEIAALLRGGVIV